MALIIKNGQVVSEGKLKKCSIRIENEVITHVGDVEETSQDTVVDANNSYVLPGGVDVHTHLDLDTGTMRTADDFETGTKAAIAGGTTTIVDFATQDKGGTLKEAVEAWDQRAKDKAYCDYGYHMAIIDWNQNISDEMKDMVDIGIPSFKLYMAYKNTLQVDDSVIFEALRKSSEVNGIIGFHCENGDLVVKMIEKLINEGKTSPAYHPISRPDVVEEESIFRLCTIAQLADAPIWVVHLSTQKGLEVIQKMKKRGVNIITETCPQYLCLDDSLYGEKDTDSFEGAKYVISPPLRKKADIEAMWQGIQSGDIDVISTDHCSFTMEQKKAGLGNFSKIPNGGPGLEHRMLLLYNLGVVDKKITLEKMVDLLSTSPSKIFGLDKKGDITPGKDADIVILDPNKQTVISAENQFQNLDYTPYEGMKMRGAISKVFLRGKEIFSDGSFNSNEPEGKFQRRKCFTNN